MNFLSLIATLTLLISSALAQSIFIGAPSLDQDLQAGKNFTVTVNQPDSLTSVENVATIIALQSCSMTDCDDPSAYLGTPLYYGPFDPQFQGPGYPYQNFSVRIPPYFPSGKASLTATLLALVGASSYPLFETKNVTVYVIDP